MPSLSAAPAPPAAREKLAVRLLIALLLLAITVPYLLAATHVPRDAVTPPGALYGGLLYNADDQNVHLAWAKQARDGHFFFADLFTHESLSTRPLFTNLFCALMGLMARAMPLILAYHGLRVVCAALALWALWKLSGRVMPDPRARLTALALTAFGGGVGFLAPLFPNFTFIDRPDGALMMPEAFTFASALIFPLFIAAMALLLAVYNAVLAGDASSTKPDRSRATLCAFAAALLLSNIHTYDVIPLCVALLLWAGFETLNARRTGAAKPNLAPVGGALLGAALPLLYQLVVFRGSQEFRVKALTVTAAPPPLSIILSYGPLLLLAMWGAFAGRDARAVRLMALWAATTLVLIYAPVSFARKMMEGVHLPLCLLASVGLWALLNRVASRVVSRSAAGGLVALMSLSSLGFVLWCLDNASTNNAARLQVFSPPLYLPPGDAAALRWLDASPQRRERAVLCLPYIGNYLPRATGRTVYLGHWAETLYFTGTRDHPSKLGEASRFFGVFGAPQMSAEEARAWLHQNHIGVVVMGFYEQQSGAKLPLPLPLLHRVGDTTLYGVDIDR